MLGKKARGYEEKIARLESELAEQKKTAGELNEVLADYRGKESAIAGALTRAQTDANRIVEEARAEQNDILAQAEQDAAALREQANNALEQARRDADALMENANARAEKLKDEAEAILEESRKTARHFDAALKRAAGEAARNAEVFREYYETVAANHEQSARAHALQTPEEYENPAELMRTIYAIEDRDVPDTVKAYEAICEGMDEEAEQDRELWQDDEPCQGEEEPEEPARRVTAPAQEEEPHEEHPFGVAYGHWHEQRYHRANVEYHPELEHDHHGERDSDAPAVNVSCEKPDEAQTPEHQPENPQPVEAEQEPRVWTVEEIIHNAPQQKETDDADGIDDELNAIIEDVLKGA